MSSSISSKSSEATRKRDFLLLALTAFFHMAALGIQMSIFYNWSRDTLNIQPIQLGIVESFREAPGLVMIFVAALTARVAEPKLAGISLFLFSLGLAAYSRVGGITSLVLISIVWSSGLHTWMPLSSSMALRLSESGNHGKRLGQIWSAGSLGMLCGIALVRIFASHISYNTWWLVAAIFAAAGAATVMKISNGHSTIRPRFVFKRKYGVYYGLTLLEGCRKQVFITFAVYVLVKEFDTSLKAIATLMLLNNALAFFAAPRVGRLIDKIGERKALMASYTALIGVFFGYAFFHHIHALYVMYCLDSLLFLTAVGNSTYLKKIAEPQDITPSLSTGVTMNHIAAVAVPIAGGILWDKFGYQPVFIGGAAIVFISLFFANKARAPIEQHKLIEEGN